MPPLLPTYIGEKGRTLGKTYMGLKRGAIGNTLGEHIRNLMGTHWELEGNILGAKENEKNPHPPIQNLKENKIKAL